MWQLIFKREHQASQNHSLTRVRSHDWGPCLRVLLRAGNAALRRLQDVSQVLPGHHQRQGLAHAQPPRNQAEAPPSRILTLSYEPVIYIIIYGNLFQQIEKQAKPKPKRHPAAIRTATSLQNS